jgi:hypothetical protein
LHSPKPPDPVATAEAQAGMNRDTGISQQLLNMVDTNNPWGSTSYSQNGTTGYTDSTGKFVSIPQFTQTTTLSPSQQAIFDQAQSAEGNLAGIAKTQSQQVADTLSKPFSFDNQDAEKWAYDLGAERILPEQQRQESALRTHLVNAGIRPGTQAWDVEMSRQGRTNDDQLSQLMLNGRNQAFSEAVATRNQPLNELSALLSGSQVSNPAQMSGPTPQTSVGGVDYSGLIEQNYAQKSANQNALMGGLFGLAGAATHFIPGFQG